MFEACPNILLLQVWMEFKHFTKSGLLLGEECWPKILLRTAGSHFEHPWISRLFWCLGCYLLLVKVVYTVLPEPSAEFTYLLLFWMAKAKVLNLIYGHLIQVSSVLGTGAKYIIYLKTLTLYVFGSRSAVAASSHTEEWNLKQIVKLVVGSQGSLKCFHQVLSFK